MAKCLLMCGFSCGEAEILKKTDEYRRDNGDNQLENRLLDSMSKAVLTVCRHPDRPLPWSLGSGRKTLASLSVCCDGVHAAAHPPRSLPTGGIAGGYGLFDCSSFLLFARISVSLPLRFMPFVPAKVNVPIRMPSSRRVPEKISPHSGSYSRLRFSGKLVFIRLRTPFEAGVKGENKPQRKRTE